MLGVSLAPTSPSIVQPDTSLDPEDSDSEPVPLLPPLGVGYQSRAFLSPSTSRSVLILLVFYITGDLWSGYIHVFETILLLYPLLHFILVLALAFSSSCICTPTLYLYWMYPSVPLTYIFVVIRWALIKLSYLISKNLNIQKHSWSWNPLPFKNIQERFFTILGNFDCQSPSLVKA